ncbi:hypothetical protein SBOR_1959 [Sclerotinia borealis F-4128]|uniref:Major facilitator superfamily (MFS) profile domain-containing protein n=1 Tax=Sclerotinia borealis (strain F-4128) TaxID=1432307 RepID=W9CNL8_SCLBF|nr:hypothetical protein SBOR_1959 [Sclerotinia borealis F-4128]
MATTTETPKRVIENLESETREEKVVTDEVENVDITPPGEEVQITKELDRLITKKFDRHIVPWLFGLWLLAFIDRSNIGNAKIDGLAADLGILQGTKFNIALAIFYVPYICVDIPSNWLVKRVGAGHYLPSMIIAWGIISLCIGWVKTWKGLLVARFFLGLMEGGLLGGIIIYLAMFYRRHQLMRRIGLFYCAAPLSGAFGGLLATGLSEIKTRGYNGWPFIFFVEGAITIVFGIITIFFLPHTPSHSKFLTEEERYVAIHRMKLDYRGASPVANIDNEKFSWHWVRLAVFNWNTWLLSLNFFAVITPIYSFSLFLPTIITALGYTRVNANLLTVPPNMVAFLSVILVTSLSDYFKRRGIFMLICASIAIIGYIMLITTSQPHIQYGGTFLVAAGSFACPPIVMGRSPIPNPKPPILPISSSSSYSPSPLKLNPHSLPSGWLANNTSPHYVRASASGLQIGLANIAAFIATFTYIAEDEPRYVTGHAINLGMLGLCLVVTSVTMGYCRWENRMRERGMRDGRLVEGNVGELGHRHPDFRYTV